MSHLPPESLDPKQVLEPAHDVRAIAVAGIILGTLGVSCFPFNFGAWITYGWPIAGSKTHAMDLWCYASTYIGLFLSAALLLCSLGCYHLKTWSRYGLLMWAWASLAYAVAGIYFWGRFLLPWLREQYPAMRGPDEISGLIAWVVGTGLAAITLWFLTRPSVRATFEAARPHSSAVA